MKGIEKYEREAKRATNASKPAIESKPITESKESVQEEKKVAGHSQKRIGSFLTNLLEKTQDWIRDDVE
jgi:hypothetical protein